MRGGPSIIGRHVRALRALRHTLTVSREHGFTIVEVLIVLVVTGALFISAVIMISGRQSQTAFQQAAQQIQAEIQQVMNEVSTGFYPNKNDFRCTAGGGGTPPSLAPAATAQGTNSGCIFLGKAIQFGLPATDPERFAVYTIAGLQRGGAGGGESSTLAQARPMLVARSSPSHSAATYPDNSSEEQLQNGLTVSRVWYRNGGGDVEVGGIAFVNSLAQFGGSGELLSGSGRVNVVAIDGTALGADKLNFVELLNSDGVGGNRLVTGTLNPTGGVFVCFASGGTDDYAIVQIGGERRDLAVTLTSKDKAGATCTYP